MNITEIISKAKSLDKSGNYNEVVSLLKEYVNDNLDNKTLIALYEKNIGIKAFIDNDVDMKKLYSDGGINRYQGVPEDKVLNIAEFLFKQEIADFYVSDDIHEGKKKSSFQFLALGISSLGERLEDYNYLEKVLNSFREIMYYYDLGDKFYQYLSIIVDWRSKVSENILHYLVKKASGLINVASNKDLYDSYIKDMSNNIFPFEEKPTIREGKVVAKNIKTQEAFDFWKGYFAYVKNVREKEYETYMSILSNKDHEFHEEIKIGSHISDIWNKRFLDGTASPEELVKMNIATNWERIKQTEKNYIDRIKEAEQLYNNIKLSLLDQIKMLINKLIGKK